MRAIIAFFSAIVMFILGVVGIRQPEPPAGPPPATTATTTTLPQATLPPGSWDAPEAFWPVLNNLCPAGPVVRSFAVADINNDGAPELILFSSYHESTGQSLHSLYTVYGSEAVPLIQWESSRVSHVIAQDGTIFSWGSNSSANQVFTTYRLNFSADRLTLLTWHETDFINGEWVFREGYDSPWQPSTEEKSQQLLEQFETITPMRFNAIPIEQ